MSKYQENVLRFSFRKNSFFVEKEIHIGISSVAITNGFHVHCFDLYPMNISTKSTKAECRTDVMKADILLFICYHSIPKFITKIQIERHKYFRYTLFGSPQCYFRCTAGAQLERAPNFSCPGFIIY